MNFTIKSSELSVDVNPIGMELCSIRSNSTNFEYLWQADPAIWKGSAPVLFPIIGVLKDGFTKIGGNKYQIPKHGLVRNSSKPKLVKSTSNYLIFRYSSDEETLENYPFNFQFEIVFTLEGKTLSVEHFITNQGNETMLYSLGAHPAFNCPLHPGEKYEEYFLEFPFLETDSTYLVKENGLIRQETEPMLDNSKLIRLSGNLFDNDALIFKHLKSREVTLKHQSKGAVLSVKFDDFDYLGIWAKPGAPFVCIEPWLGIGDNVDTNQKFEEKEGIIQLPPLQTDVKKYTITILE